MNCTEDDGHDTVEHSASHDFVTEWCIEELPHDHVPQQCQCGSRSEGAAYLE